MKNTKSESDLIKDEHKEHKTIKILKDIHSAYLIKDIFSFINKKQKMDLIAYNKKLQEKELIQRIIKKQVENTKKLKRMGKEENIN